MFIGVEEWLVEKEVVPLFPKHHHAEKAYDPFFAGDRRNGEGRRS
jgi:hypothetical protein